MILRRLYWFDFGIACRPLRVLGKYLHRVRYRVTFNDGVTLYVEP